MKLKVWSLQVQNLKSVSGVGFPACGLWGLGLLLMGCISVCVRLQGLGWVAGLHFRV